jgi:hypothetical protein
MQHIEKNLCKNIKNEDLVARREEKLAFARELQRRHRGEDVDLPSDLSVATLSLAETASSVHGPYNFTKHLSRAEGGPDGTPSLSSLRPRAENTVRPSPVTFSMKETEFPQLPSQPPNRGQSDLFTGDQKHNAKQPIGNQWGQKKLFSNAPPAVRPTAEHLESLQQPRKTETTSQKEATYQPHDPRDPTWNASEYYVKFIGKYKCPHARCA